MASGVVLWAGPSLLDPNERVVVVGTDKSKNTKTGKMKQIWFLPMRVSPHDAVRDHGSIMVCGDCALRPHSGHPRWSGRCCVNKRCPNEVWKSWRYGHMDIVDPEEYGKNSFLRIGAWGDPASVPLEFFGSLLKFSSGWTAYTHMWGICNTHFNSFCMASVQNINDMKKAKHLGYRTFRVLDDADSLVGGERLCSYVIQKTKCIDCLSCCGMSCMMQQDIAIIDHSAITMSAKARKGKKRIDK